MKNDLSFKQNNKGFANMFILAAIAGLIVIASLFVTYAGINPTGKAIDLTGSSNSASTLDSNVQVVKFHVEGSQYLLEPSVVRAGSTVRLVGDISRLPGCSRSISVSEFGVKKTFTSAGDYVEFTPNKAGKFYIACSMNMYKGIFEVVNSDGTKSNYMQSAPTGGMTCGAGGGCEGCGGAR